METPSSTRIVERIRVPEIPVLTETKRRIGRGDVGGALRYAYPEVIVDLSRAYHRPFAVGWTHEEIVREGFSEEMHPLLDFFEGLWSLYAPFRYGGLPPREDGARLIELLRSLYSTPPMWRLYLASARPGKTQEPERAPQVPADRVHAVAGSEEE